MFRSVDYLQTDLGKQTLKKLSIWLKDNNQFVQKYKTAVGRQKNEPENNLGVIFEEKGPSNQHERRWNLPQGGGMCGLICNLDEVNMKDTYRDIVIQAKGSTELRSIYETHRLYDPLHYVLLFPCGKVEGWDLYTKNKEEKRLTSLKYYRYRIMERPASIEPNYLFQAGVLYQKYLIDMYSKILMQQLRWCEQNQSKVRAASFQEVYEAIEEDFEDQPGKRIILPSTVKGGDRFAFLYPLKLNNTLK